MPIKAPNAVPEGMNTITPHLWFNGNCKDAIDFYQRAFGAELMCPPAMDSEDKNVMHVMMRMGNSPIMMADAWPNGAESGPKGYGTVGMWLYVEDCDALFDRAVKAGCEVIMPMMDAFWGDRMGKVMDKFGHSWAIATHKWIMTQEEMSHSQSHMHEGGCC
jgi:PhnB protein